MHALSRSVGRALFQGQRGNTANQVRRRFSSEKPPKQPQKCRRLPRWGVIEQNSPSELGKKDGGSFEKVTFN